MDGAILLKKRKKIHLGAKIIWYMSNFGKVYYDNKVIATLPNSCYTKTKHFNRKKVAAMGFFKKKEKAAPSGDFDRENEKPIIKASICNGEQIAGFKNIHTGIMREIMLIKTSADLEYF